jgi:hypothetical protein
MVECNSLDDVGSGRDFCVARDVPIAIDLGRHMNDPVVSFHVANPSNFAIEYGWGGRLVDDSTWQVEHHSSADSLWGHRAAAGDGDERDVSLRLGRLTDRGPCLPSGIACSPCIPSAARSCRPDA